MEASIIRHSRLCRYFCEKIPRLKYPQEKDLFLFKHKERQISEHIVNTLRLHTCFYLPSRSLENSPLILGKNKYNLKAGVN